MATSASTPDYFSSCPAIRPSALASPAANSPRTPLLGRSISSQFGTPGAFRSEQEDFIVYELGSRHFSAGFAGESRPRCILCFSHEEGRRVGDFRAYEPGYRRETERRWKWNKEESWGAGHELYRSDLRHVDMGLVEDKLERSLRKAHTDSLQLDSKVRKAMLVVPSLLPTPVLEVAVKVLFQHFSQPPSVMILTTPILACVGAGVRNGVVVDVGWEETVVTAVGEYKEVFQRRSVRAGKVLTMEMARLVGKEAKSQRGHEDGAHDEGKTEANERLEAGFEYAEEVTQRMGWCRLHSSSSNAIAEQAIKIIHLPDPGLESKSEEKLHVLFSRLSEPAEIALFSSSDPNGSGREDDHNLSLPNLIYRTLLALPMDLRALCVSRIIVTGGVSSLPGLKMRLLQELAEVIEKRGWDPVQSYGSATARREKVLQERSANIRRKQQPQTNPLAAHAQPQPSPTRNPPQDFPVPPSERIHDDIDDSISLKAEREARKGKLREDVKGIVRGVETLGAWAGASLLASLRVKGAKEIEREDFLKNGLVE